MKSISEMMPEFEKRVAAAPKGKKRLTERGELMRFFQRHLNHARKSDGLPDISMSRMGYILEQIPTEDLYYLKSVCMKAQHFSKKFWWEIDPKKHLPENRTPF